MNKIQTWSTTITEENVESGTLTFPDGTAMPLKWKLGDVVRLEIPVDNKEDE
jgi:hypothetical protein